MKARLIATLIAASAVTLAQAETPPGPPGPGKGHRAGMMQERFKAADTNGDGKISRDEANAGLPGVAKNFDTLDANKDGFVTPDEMRAAGEKRGRAHKMHDRVKAADKDGDGKISRDEATASLPHIAKNFDAIDTDKDGAVTREELRAFREKNGGRK